MIFAEVVEHDGEADVRQLAQLFDADEVVTRYEVDQLQSNYQWINDNTPRGRFFREELEKSVSTKLVIISGMEKIPQNNKNSTATSEVKFRKAFAPACRPQVTTGIVCDFSNKVFCSVQGPGGKGLPDSSGFVVNIDIAEPVDKNAKIKNTFWVHWQAFGYRTDDMNEF